MMKVWLVGWSVGWLVGWSVGWLVGWLAWSRRRWVRLMGDCLAVVNLAEVSRMDYNCDVTELTINPRIPYFFFSFVLFFLGRGGGF